MSSYNVAEAKNQLSRLIDAQRLGATLVTFDRRMADSARALGIAVAVPRGIPRHERRVAGFVFGLRNKFAPRSLCALSKHYWNKL